MIHIPSFRDLLIMSDGTTAYLSAVDSCGGIGSLPHDALAVPPETVGLFTARTALLEVLCAGGEPVSASVAAANGPDIAQRLLEGIREALGTTLPFIISTEKNMPTSMTALGVTVTGTCPVSRLRLGGGHKGDLLYCAGVPLVGAETLEEGVELPSNLQIQKLLQLPGIRTALPVGSQGIAAEAQILARESGLEVQLLEPPLLDLLKSAGPSSCILFTADPHMGKPEVGLEVFVLGVLA